MQKPVWFDQHAGKTQKMGNLRVLSTFLRWSTNQVFLYSYNIHTPIIFLTPDRFAKMYTLLIISWFAISTFSLGSRFLHFHLLWF